MYHSRWRVSVVCVRRVCLGYDVRICTGELLVVTREKVVVGGAFPLGMARTGVLSRPGEGVVVIVGDGSGFLGGVTREQTGVGSCVGTFGGETVTAGVCCNVSESFTSSSCQYSFP